jgi:hypothetical protein
VLYFSYGTFTRGHIIHTIQIILVEADSPEEAFRYVEQTLENDNSPAWSDWHNASGWEEKDFAGRWSGQVFITPEQEALIEAGTLDKDTIPNYLCYADDPELADYVIDKFLGYRKQAMRECVPAVGIPDLSTLIDEYNPAGVPFLAHDFWKIGKLIELLGDDWNYESAVYDLSSWTASLRDYHERCAKNPQKQYLIPVDFHH